MYNVLGKRGKIGKLWKNIYPWTKKIFHRFGLSFTLSSCCHQANLKTFEKKIQNSVWFFLPHFFKKNINWQSTALTFDREVWYRSTENVLFNLNSFTYFMPLVDVLKCVSVAKTHFFRGIGGLLNVFLENGVSSLFDKSRVKTWKSYQNISAG